MSSLVEAALAANAEANKIPDSANPKDAQARKKVPVGLVPPALVIGAAEALADGARKYGAYNWRDIAIRFSVYIEAIERHTLALKDGEDIATDSKIHHLKHIAAGVAIALDALGHGNLIDDRKVGPGAKLLAEAHQKQLAQLLVQQKALASFEDVVKHQSQQQRSPGDRPKDVVKHKSQQQGFVGDRPFQSSIPVDKGVSYGGDTAP